MPFAPVASPAARQTVKGAFEGLKQVITPQDSRDFHKTTLQDVRKAALDIESQLAARQSLRNMRRLIPLFRGLEHYEKAMGVLCNGTPYLPWVWAPITLILRVACEYVEAFEQIMKGYSRIASALKRFEILGDALCDKPDFQTTLAVFYADILQFHKHAYKFVRRNGWKLLFLTSWGRFQRRFDNIVEDMERQEALIDLEANAHNIAEERQLRQDIKLWREKSLEEMQRRDEEHVAKQYKAIMSWLKVDESDQLTIFDSISAEGAKHPGTCGWILKTPKVRAWLQKQRDTPMLWLQGSPGTGKTVLSAQLINFMKAAGDMLVLHHFCAYSYPSSTLYEQILRSLLLQLFRKDGDLVAHVYNECVLGKKPPTLSALEHLLQVLLTSLSSEPCRTEHIWILLDGLDECEADKQARLVSLMNQVVSKTSSSGTTVCKVLVSSRPTGILTKRLGKKQILSLGDEKAALEDAIRQYASQRLQSLHRKLSQLDIGSEELKEIEHGVARKADGMFLYARLVLDYIATNIFFSGEEIKTSINRLPDKLTDFYRRILTQILAHLDTRSVERIKCILGWIAFSKRPLKKLEFLSAISFSSGDPNISHLAPQYILDICEPLVEERRDSTLAFIHVSVKDFVQSTSSNLVIREKETLQQHAAAVLACLLSGLDVFSAEYPDHSKAVRVVKGIHGLHLYATEYWTEYLLSQASRTGGIRSDRAVLRLARQLADKLESLDSVCPHNIDASQDMLDDRLALLGPHETLRKHVGQSLASRTMEQMEREILNEQGGGSATPSPGASDSVSTMLRAYQECVRSILSQHDLPGVTAEELDLFKRQFQTSAFTCRLKLCPRATLGFDSAQLLREHELSHVCRLNCPFPGCQYPPFVSAQALRSHERKHHQQGNQIRRPIRRVRGFREAPSSTSVAAAARADGYTDRQQDSQSRRPRRKRLAPTRAPSETPLPLAAKVERHHTELNEEHMSRLYPEKSLPRPRLGSPLPPEQSPLPSSPSLSSPPSLLSDDDDSRGGVPLPPKTRGRKNRRDYPSSWGFDRGQMTMKKRVLAVFDGPRRLAKSPSSQLSSAPSRSPSPLALPSQNSAPNTVSRTGMTGYVSDPPAVEVSAEGPVLADASWARPMTPIAAEVAVSRATTMASEPLELLSGLPQIEQQTLATAPLDWSDLFADLGFGSRIEPELDPTSTFYEVDSLPAPAAIWPEGSYSESGADLDPPPPPPQQQQNALYCLPCQYFPTEGIDQRRKLAWHLRTDTHRRNTAAAAGDDNDNDNQSVPQAAGPPPRPIRKPFPCPVAGCGSAFHRRDTMSMHVKRKHNKTPRFSQNKVVFSPPPPPPPPPPSPLNGQRPFPPQSQAQEVEVEFLPSIQKIRLHVKSLRAEDLKRPAWRGDLNDKDAAIKRLTGGKMNWDDLGKNGMLDWDNEELANFGLRKVLVPGSQQQSQHEEHLDLRDDIEEPRPGGY